MAGDWIKMRVDLAADPAVIGISSALDCTEFEVVGMLHHFWSWADAQSRDGNAAGVTKKWVDRYVHREGFADQLEKVGWLMADADGITVPNFDKHNGKPAKTRALGTKRQQVHRDILSRDERDNGVTREEKRREDQEPLPSKPASDQNEAPAKLAKFSCSDIQDAYNEICSPIFPACAVMNDKRKRQIKAMCAIEFMGSKPFILDIEVWRQYFADCLTDPHWCGQNARSWRADFDFVTNTKNAIKLMERMN